MGGHGGLNILPQKKWNVYNYENREKVRQDEEAAACEEQLKREQSRRRDAEFRIERLRQARGLPNSTSASNSSTADADSRHLNLFDGLKGFESLSAIQDGGLSGMKQAKEGVEDVGLKSGKKRKREDATVKVQLEDEKYKLGYGLVGKGVEAPWYASKPSFSSFDDGDKGADGRRSVEADVNGSWKKNGCRKTIDDLREERMRREKKEKERERSLLASLGKKREDRRFSGRV